MEKKIRNQRIIIILLAVLLVINFYSLSSLNTKLDNINNNLNNGIQSVRSSISNISYDIERIKDENEATASLITSFEYEYGELDEGDFTVPVKVKIVPKAVGDDTAISLEFDGKTVALNKSEGSTEFTATFERGIFEKGEDDSVRVVIKSKGISETEELDWYISDLASELLPYATASYVFDDIKLSEKSGIIVDGTVAVFLDDEEADGFSNTRLIYKLNGEVVAEEETNGDEHIQIYKTFPGYGAGDTLELYFEAEDHFGFIHETMLKRVYFGDNGELTEEAEVVDKLSEIIKDKDGNVLSW